MTSQTSETATTAPTENKAPTARLALAKTKAAAKPKTISRPKASAVPQSKQDRILTLLRRKEGATVAATMKVTGWQAHTMRGFFAGVVRKKLKLNLTSQETNGKRTYRIAAGKSANAVRSRRKRVA